jgi:hypothetical protein
LLPLDVITLGGAVDLVFRIVASGGSARPEGGVSGVTTVRESPLAGGPVPEGTEIERPTRPPALGPGRAPGDTLPDAWDPGPPPGETDTEPRSRS